MQSLRESSCRGRKLNNAFPQLKYPQNRCPAFLKKKDKCCTSRNHNRIQCLRLKLVFFSSWKTHFGIKLNGMNHSKLWIIGYQIGKLWEIKIFKNKLFFKPLCTPLNRRWTDYKRSSAALKQKYALLLGHSFILVSLFLEISRCELVLIWIPVLIVHVMVLSRPHKIYQCTPANVLKPKTSCVILMVQKRSEWGAETVMVYSLPTSLEGRKALLTNSKTTIYLNWSSFFSHNTA